MAEHTVTSKEELANSILFDVGSPNEAYTQYFSGESFMSPLVADANIPVHVANVSFEPGCRNNWHIHMNGFQILLVTAGEGWYQEEGKPAQRISKGDVLVGHSGVKHWHVPPKTAGSHTSPSHPVKTNGSSQYQMTTTRRWKMFKAG